MLNRKDELKDRVIGALAVCDGAGRVFLESEIRLAQAFADHAARSIPSCHGSSHRSAARVSLHAICR